jgi:hypothetical protein
MKKTNTAMPTKTTPAATTLAEVVERLSINRDLSDTRKRDLR